MISNGAMQSAPTIMNEPTHPNRKRNRLEDYDYSKAGAYFVTICTHQRRCLFGQILDGTVSLSDCGKIVHEEWFRTEQIRPNVSLDAFVAMPNHVHGVIMIDYPWLGHRTTEDAKQSLERIVAGFKAACVRRINAARGKGAVWQKSFHDEIIRNEQHLTNVRNYIAGNPAEWDVDEENPDRS